ncbi:MAG: hypothetical protein AAGE80_08295, partial [Pseudomonadota bacterium]
ARASQGAGRGSAETMRPLNRAERFSLQVVLVCSMIWTADFMFRHIVPYVEGRIAPVITPLEVDIERSFSGDGFTVAIGSSQKKRNCEYRGIEWWIGHRGKHRLQVPAEFLDEPQMRAVGDLYWREGLRVSISREQFGRNSHGDVLHSCWPVHIGDLSFDLWLTRTPFFDGM